jgi:hypothetical protein
LPAAGHMDCLDPCSEGHRTLCRWLGQSTNTVAVP